MKLITILYLIAQSFDLLTTYVGLSIGIAELNPLYHKFGLIVITSLKIFTIIISAYLLEKLKTRGFYYIVPALCWLVVLWNTYSIAYVLVNR